MTRMMHDYTAEQAQQEHIELLVKAGRRCAYDLKHATDFMKGDDDLRDALVKSYEKWLTVFNPGDDGKNYRHRLHHTIIELDRKCETLMAICKRNKIETPWDEDELPF